MVFAVVMRNSTLISDFFINPEDMFLDYSTIPEGCDCLYMYMYNEIYSDLSLTIFSPLWGKFYKIRNKEWR